MALVREGLLDRRMATICPNVLAMPGSKQMGCQALRRP